MSFGAGRESGALGVVDSVKGLSPFHAVVPFVSGGGESNLNNQGDELIEHLEGGVQGRAGLAFGLFGLALNPASVAGLNILMGRTFGFRAAAEVLPDDLPIDPP